MRSPNKNRTPFGPGFGPGFAGPIDPEETPFGRRHQHPRFGRGPGGRGPRGMGRGRGRALRGDVRAAILLLLETEPMHGYQLMQAIADRTGGRWTPSPGAIYPAISLLEDEGLVTARPDAGRKVIELTEAGREYVAANREGWADPFSSDDQAGDRPDLRGLLMQLHAATRQVGMAGTAAQVEKAATILADARRALYLLLADGPDAPQPDDDTEPGHE